jgi:competence protein ComEA
MGRAEGPQPLGPGEKLDPNTASAADLARLPRGRGLAERIVADRTANGAYRSILELDRVAGIGPATLEAWRELLTLPWEVAGAATAAVASSSTRGATVGREADRLVDLNRATAVELEALPGIGPALAERIVAWRTRNGRFRTLEDLIEVRGIGPATLERLRPYLKLGA